jgi:glycosyltransferase involved in cell wall biosynthesis
VPEVSVVLATHDQGRWLDEAIASVRAQTLADWELLVVDDGSTDDTPAIAARHAAADARIRVLAGPRVERCRARNRGIAEARAPLVAFLDGDDAWAPGKLARQRDALAAAPDAAFCWTVTRVVDAEGRPLPERKPKHGLGADAFATLARGNVLILSSVMARRDAVLRAGGFDPALATLGCEDWDLWLRLARDAPAVGVDAELTRYRRHGDNTPRANVLAGALRVIDAHWRDPETARRSGLSRAAARALHLWWHAAALALGDRRAALAVVRQALAEAPATVSSRPALHALSALVVPRRSLAR